MNLKGKLAALAVVVAGLVVPGATTSVSAAVETPAGPALVVPASTLQAALQCSSDLATPAKTPILLIPGTVTSPRSAYSWGYQPVLRAQNYPVCTVTLPNGGVGDMQTTVEYVVNAIRSMHATSGRKISLIGHSQGGLLEGWALRFWPDLADMVDDSISLDGPFGGSYTGDFLCGIDACPQLVWQIRRDSNWSRAVSRYPTPLGVSFTSIGSLNDDLVRPAPDATHLPGATNLMVQDLCPGRVVHHLDFLWDSAAYALTMDALTHAGGANVSRTATTACSKTRFDGIDTLAMGNLLFTLTDLLAILFSGEFVEPNEARLRDYAIGTPGDTNLALNRPVTVSSTQDSLVGSRAVDGNQSTRWGSDWSDNQWIYVDLGSTKSIGGVQLSWEAAHADDYDIQVWNGTAWQTVHTNNNGQGDHEFIPLENVNARYVAVRGRNRATGYGYSLYEFTVAAH